ncbi:PREDICTED: ras-responsive element-binding protein 1-like [Priapulus caudatus]|uniref:Ras-responsive element-binding protein 1-like n=1 Tax=Priapulus caudatus TaxID=37621 RepID=A0ABM1EE23_PRICU|nr:PREDICTED: ras-responsive element-binding protein 1-like [Priapulus caudatus]
MGNLRRHCQLKHGEHDLATLLAHVMGQQGDGGGGSNSFSVLDVTKIRANMDRSLEVLHHLGDISDDDDDEGGEEAEEEEEEEEGEEPGDSDTAYYCRHCDDVFASMHELVVHSGERHGDASPGVPAYRCHVCDDNGRAFTQRDACLAHIRERHPDEFAEVTPGGAGDSDATSPDYSERHFLCAFCPKRFWSSQDWRRHLRTHSGERPYQCRVCRRRFSLKHSMMRHLKIHLDEAAAAAAAAGEGADVGGAADAMHVDDGEAEEAEEAESPGEDVGGGSLDMIQNLLGLEDASMIDKMLESADKAAEMLGVTT